MGPEACGNSDQALTTTAHRRCRKDDFKFIEPTNENIRKLQSALNTADALTKELDDKVRAATAGIVALLTQPDGVRLRESIRELCRLRSSLFLAKAMLARIDDLHDVVSGFFDPLERLTNVQIFRVIEHGTPTMADLDGAQN